MLESAWSRHPEQPNARDDRGQPRVSESKIGAWIAWGFAVAFGTIYLWHFFQSAEPPIAWKPFAILEGGSIGVGLLLFTAPGNAVDLILDRIRGKSRRGG